MTGEATHGSRSAQTDGPWEINMPKTAHSTAAEHHEKAAKLHRTAAEHHGKGDHTSASKHSE